MTDIEMVFVQGGTFTMGATAEQLADAWDWEVPTHPVTLNDFYIGKYAVTRAQWESVMGKKPVSRFEALKSAVRNALQKGVAETEENLPIEAMNWMDVRSFINKLNAATGKRYRLPTEAEWEYAARGGNNSRGYKYSGSDNADEVAWFNGNSGGKAHPVGTKRSNELGIYDMSGNVCEWCQDWYGEYDDSEQTNPLGPQSGLNRVVRGGTWSDEAGSSRVSYRFSYKPVLRYYGVGFRLAM